MERKKAIENILGAIRPSTDVGIDIHLWLAADEGKPGEPDFEDWLRACTRMVDAYEADYGEIDVDSHFAQYVAKYGRREY